MSPAGDGPLIATLGEPKRAERFLALTTTHTSWLPGAAGPWTWSAEGSLRAALSEEVSLGLSARALPGGVAEGGLDAFVYY
ncbi:MAG: hypothetical protein NVSMB1_21360 [Polyangiales bacterium]